MNDKRILNKRHEGYRETLNKYVTVKDAAWQYSLIPIWSIQHKPIFVQIAPSPQSHTSNSAPYLWWCKTRDIFWFFGLEQELLLPSS